MPSLLTPMLALITLTAVLGLWAAAVDVFDAAMVGTGGSDGTRHGGAPSAALRGRAAYKHLLEQPVAFYAIVLYIVFRGHTDEVHIYLAWAYVGLWGLHSLIQCLADNVSPRRAVFALSSLVLMAMALREVLAFL
jgi:hypothetical protein